MLLLLVGATSFILTMSSSFEGLPRQEPRAARRLQGGAQLVRQGLPAPGPAQADEEKDEDRPEKLPPVFHGNGNKLTTHTLWTLDTIHQF